MCQFDFLQIYLSFILPTIILSSLIFACNFIYPLLLIIILLIFIIRFFFKVTIIFECCQFSPDATGITMAIRCLGLLCVTIIYLCYNDFKKYHFNFQNLSYNYHTLIYGNLQTLLFHNVFFFFFV